MINEYDIEDMSDSIADHETESKKPITSKVNLINPMFGNIDMALYMDSDSVTFDWEMR